MEVILTKVHETVLVDDLKNSQNVVVAVQPAPTTIITGQVGPAGETNISRAKDVDLTDLADGSILAYKVATEKWTASLNLGPVGLDGGQY
jgi:hypothetical protein